MVRIETTITLQMRVLMMEVQQENFDRFQFGDNFKNGFRR